MEEPNDTRDSTEGDELVESAVLFHVLALHPTHLTLEELVRELAGDPTAFPERNAIERAVRNLSGAGALHRNGEFVLPTRTALRLDELLCG
jgi:hypothetical protein